MFTHAPIYLPDLARGQITSKLVKDFNYLRDLPFRLTRKRSFEVDQLVLADFDTPNCLLKNSYALYFIRKQGLKAEHCLAEMQDWHNFSFFPSQVLKALPEGFTHTHYYLKLQHPETGKTTILDATLSESFARTVGLPYSVLGEENEPCFPIKKEYSQH